jgi:hypothetical protein
MASRGKKKTTMAKLNRESKLRERRVEKKARKDQRKLAALNPELQADDAAPGTEAESEDEQPVVAGDV